MVSLRGGKGDYERAYVVNNESLALYRQLGNRWAEALLGLDGEYLLAARLMGAALPVRESIFATVEPLTRANLDKATLLAAWKEGRHTTLDEVVRIVLADYQKH